MTRLTEDLLTLARVESGEHRFAIQPVSAEELLRDAAGKFREVARSYDVELGVELAIENSVSAANVNADREAIHQVFSNLIENALKYAASGKEVILGARAAESGVEKPASNSMSGTSGPAFPPSICRVFSSASIAWIKRARGNREAPGWGSPSRSISFWRTEGRSVPRANLTTARPFCSRLPASEADST